MPVRAGEDEYYYSLDELERKHPLVAFFEGLWWPIEIWSWYSHLEFFQNLRFKWLFQFLFREPNTPAKEAWIKLHGEPETCPECSRQDIQVLFGQEKDLLCRVCGYEGMKNEFIKRSDS